MLLAKGAHRIVDCEIGRQLCHFRVREYIMTRAQLSAQRKAKLASRLDDNTMLVAAAAYYLDKLSPGWSSAGEMFEHEKTLSSKWRWHLAAIRRVLGMHSRKEPPLYR
jgi:hypothetical protein